jgi:hypothetical protein
MFFRICGAHRAVATVKGRSGTRILPHCGAKVNNHTHQKERNPALEVLWFAPAIRIRVSWIKAGFCRASARVTWYQYAISAFA